MQTKGGRRPSVERIAADCKRTSADLSRGSLEVSCRVNGFVSYNLLAHALQEPGDHLLHWLKPYLLQRCDPLPVHCAANSIVKVTQSTASRWCLCSQQHLALPQRSKPNAEYRSNDQKAASCIISLQLIHIAFISLVYSKIPTLSTEWHADIFCALKNESEYSTRQRNDMAHVDRNELEQTVLG